MAKVKDVHSEMAHARQSDGINVIFDQKSPASSRSRSRSRSRSNSDSSCSSGSRRYRGRVSHRGRYRSPSSSSSSTSSRCRSRSHPRCHRASSRCRCDNHRRYGRRRSRRSPSRRYREHSHSYSRSPSSDRYSRYRSNRSRSRSSSRRSRHRRAVSRYVFRSSQSPSRNYRSRSRSRSSGRSVSLSVNEKRELLQAAKENAKKILGMKELELPESVKPILSEKPVEAKQLSPEPETRVRQDPEKVLSQSMKEEPEDESSPKMSPKRKIISFSMNNSLVKPVVAAPSTAKVTPRVDLYESKKPYGHWIPVKSAKTSSKARKHTLTKSH